MLFGSGEQWGHAAVLEAIAAPPAGDKTGQPGSACRLCLPVEHRRIMAVIGAACRLMRRVLDAHVSRIDVFPMHPPAADRRHPHQP